MGGIDAGVNHGHHDVRSRGIKLCVSLVGQDQLISRLRQISPPHRAAVVVDRSRVRQIVGSRSGVRALRLHYLVSLNRDDAQVDVQQGGDGIERPRSLDQEQLAGGIAQAVVHAAVEQLAQVQQVGQAELVPDHEPRLWRGLRRQALDPETQEQQQRQNGPPGPRLLDRSDTGLGLIELSHWFPL